MKTGSILTASFTLIEDVGTTLTGRPYRSVAITADKLENKAAGLEINGFLGSVNVDQRSIHLPFATYEPVGKQIDGSPAPCPTFAGVIAYPSYYLDTKLQNDRTFSGTLEFSCSMTSTVVDSQPIIVTRID